MPKPQGLCFTQCPGKLGAQPLETAYEIGLSAQPGHEHAPLWCCCAGRAAGAAESAGSLHASELNAGMPNM